MVACKGRDLKLKRLVEPTKVLEIMKETKEGVVLTIGAGDIDRLVSPLNKILRQKILYKRHEIVGKNSIMASLIYRSNTRCLFGNEKEMSETVKAPQINIKVNGPDTFLTDQELILRLKNAGLLFEGKVHEKLNINKIESFVLKMPEVRRAQVYKRINNDWNIEIELIKPIARIFNNSGETYYLDADGKKMKRSDLHTARILVFTGNIHDKFNMKMLFQLSTTTP